MDQEKTDDAWPDWPISISNVGELARYVDVSFTPSLVPAGLSGQWKPPGGRARAAQLYEQLRARQITYAKEDWNPARYLGGDTEVLQRIRDPQQTVQGPATCLDLALVFAGMALSVDMRPLIGFRSGDVPHALVVLDLTTPTSEQPAAEDRRPIPGFAARADAPGVWDSVAAPGGPAWALGELAAVHNWLIVDVYRAAVGEQGGFAFPEASGQVATGLLRGAESGSPMPWALVDVDIARGGLPPYVPQRGRAVPPIHGFLPAVPAFTSHPSRRRLMADLQTIVRGRESVRLAERDEGAVVILQGPSGYGKSMLAHRIAVGADRGCGWVLNATDVSTLTTSLAQAERAERGWRDELADAIEQHTMAAEALSRLRESTLPWVVVLDNCDVPPDTEGLEERMPRPGHAGQVVIVTTTNGKWEEYASVRGWWHFRLPALDEADLDGLGLAPRVGGIVLGRPLIAHSLAALSRHGVEPPELPAAGELAPEVGPALIWDLVRAACVGQPGATALAAAAAWCPAEQSLDVLALTDGADAATMADLLDRLRFVTRVATGAAAVQMHRLFAAAVRDQIWRDDATVAAETIGTLMVREASRELFINAADSTALRRLEGTKPGTGEVARAAEVLPDHDHRGLLWYGLGHIRERRGPVRESAPHFEFALQELNELKQPYEAAEATIGLARVVYQNSRSTEEDLTAARATVEPARVLIAPLGDKRARQLSEQGNALYWLIGRTLARRTKDPRERIGLLTELRDQLWLSYEQRIRIARDWADDAPVKRSAPVEEDGIGPERAYYNLAGVGLLLAQTYQALALKEMPGSYEQATLDARAAAALDETEAVYAEVRELRNTRYGHRAHPHLAACIHGLGLVAYYRATLLGDIGRLPDAVGYAAAALEQRRKVAEEAIGATPTGVLHNGDLRKSTDLLLKIAVAACSFGHPDLAQGLADAMGTFAEGAAELTAGSGRADAA